MFQSKFWSDGSYHEFAFISWFEPWCACCRDDIFLSGFEMEKVSVVTISIDVIIWWSMGKAGTYLCSMHSHLCFRQFSFWFAIFFVQHEQIKHNKCVVLNINIIFMNFLDQILQWLKWNLPQPSTSRTITVTLHMLNHIKMLQSNMVH